MLRLVLVFQGAYYALTGLWAIVSLESFSRVTGHSGGSFEMHSIAAMAVVVGAFLIRGALNDASRRAAGFLGLGLVLAVMIPEWVYLPKIDNPPLFWLDFALEGVIGLLVGVGLLRRSRC